MLQRIARLSIAAPRRILAVAVLVMVAAAVFGVPVAKSLSAGGFQDPASESARAIALLGVKFGQSGTVSFSANKLAAQPATTAKILIRLRIAPRA